MTSRMSARLSRAFAAPLTALFAFAPTAAHAQSAQPQPTSPPALGDEATVPLVAPKAKLTQGFAAIGTPPSQFIRRVIPPNPPFIEIVLAGAPGKACSAWESGVRAGGARRRELLTDAEYWVAPWHKTVWDRPDSTGNGQLADLCLDVNGGSVVARLGYVLTDRTVKDARSVFEAIARAAGRLSGTSTRADASPASSQNATQPGASAAPVAVDDEAQLPKVALPPLEHFDPAALARLDRLLDEGVAYGYYNWALPIAERLYLVRAKHRGPTHPDTERSLRVLATIAIGKADHERGDRAIAAAESAAAAQSVAKLEEVLTDYAEICETQSDLGRARKLREKAVAAASNAYGPTHPKVAIAQYRYGKTLNESGDYPAAQTQLERAISTYETALGREAGELVVPLAELGRCLLARGDLAGAEAKVDHALKIGEKLRPFDPRRRAAFRAQGALLMTQARRLLARDEPATQADRAKKAADLSRRASGAYLDAAKIASALDGVVSPTHALDLQDAGDAYMEIGFEPIARHTLAITEQAFGSGHPATATATLAYARAAWITDPGRALDAAKRAVSIRERALGPMHPDVAAALVAQALFAQAGKDFASALALRERASDVSERNLMLVLAAGTDAEKRRYAEQLAPEIDAALSLQLVHMQNDARAARFAAQTVLRRKGRVVDAMADTLGSLRAQLDADAKRLLDDLGEVRGQLATAALRGGSGSRATGAFAGSFRALQARVDELERKLSDRAGAVVATAKPVSLDAVTSAIPDDAVLVEFARYRKVEPEGQLMGAHPGAFRYAAYVVTRTGKVTGVDLGDARGIDETVARLREALSDPKKDTVSLARELDQKIFAPLVPAFGGGTRLFIAPDGALNLVPFAALQDEQGKPRIVDYRIGYLASGRDLLRAPASAAGRDAPIIVANPDFGVRESRGASGFAKITWKALPGTASEAKALARAVPRARLFTERDATEAQLKRIHGPMLLHVATHGFFLDDKLRARLAGTRGLELEALPEAAIDEPENALVYSGLVLANANSVASPEPNRDDGVLTALEASGLDLYGTKLVVLSACETGVGANASGQGVYGLRRALTIAGAESLVLSLWQVSDTATRSLMVSMYDGLAKGAPPSIALRSAQLGMLADKATSHPFYWAAFIPSGTDHAVPLGESNGVPAVRRGGGCGCRVEPVAPDHAAKIAGLVAVLAAAARRRSRRNATCRPPR